MQTLNKKVTLKVSAKGLKIIDKKGIDSVIKDLMAEGITQVNNILSRIGPGMMLAAVGVGVSHLVYSTQAGADYGLSLLWLIIAITLIKYPAFRFAVDYANATGESLVRAYGDISKLALGWLMAGFVVVPYSDCATTTSAPKIKFINC